MKPDKFIIDETTSHAEYNDISILFKDEIAFSQFIERKSVSDGTSRTQAILSFCENKLIDVDDVSHLISRQLKEKVKVEMIESGMMKSEINNLDDIC